MLPLAFQGLTQRVVRPVAAASLDLSGACPGRDLALERHRRPLLIALVAAVTAAVVATAQFGLGEVAGASPAGLDGAAGRLLDLLGGVFVALMVGLPLGIAAWGERWTRVLARRDSGVGLILGSGVAVLLVFVLPAVVTAATA